MILWCVCTAFVPKGQHPKCPAYTPFHRHLSRCAAWSHPQAGAWGRHPERYHVGPICGGPSRRRRRRARCRTRRRTRSASGFGRLL